MRVVSAGDKEVWVLGFAPVSSVLLAGSRSGGVGSFGPGGADPVTRLATGDMPAWFDFTPDGRTVRYACRSVGGAWEIDLTTGARSALTLRGGADLVRCGLSADGTLLVTTHGTPGKAIHAAWRPVAGGKWRQKWRTPKGVLFPHSLAVCPTGARLAHLRWPRATPAMTEQLLVETRDAATGKHEATGEYPFTRYEADRLLFRPDGRQLLAVYHGALVVWPVPELGEPRVVKNAARKQFTAAAYHPNGRYLFTTSNDAAVTVWNAETWKQDRRFVWNVGRLRSVTVSPDGTLAAAGTGKGQIVVWDVD